MTKKVVTVDVNLVIILHGAKLRWIWNNGSLSEHQAFANKHGGHAVAFRGNQAGRNICELPRALHAMQVKVKDALDPHRVFGKKRLFSEF